MFFDRLYYEVKLLGKRAMLTPFLLIIGFILLAFVLNARHVDPARALLGGVEMMLPIAIGAMVGTVIAQDPALELQLTVPRKYHLTGILRFLCLLVLGIVLSLIYINTLAALHMLYLPRFTQQWSPLSLFLAVQLIWLAPLLWCMAAGGCFSLLLQSHTAGVALLGAIWIAEIVFKDFIASSDWLRPLLLFPSTLLDFPPTNATPEQYNTYFLQPHYELLGITILVLITGWLLLRNAERMLKGATEE